MTWDTWTLTMISLWTLVVLLGGLVSYFAFRAYRSTGSVSMFALAGGIFLASAATGSMWIGIYLTNGLDPYVASEVCTGVTAVGFGAILYALQRRGA